MTHELVIVDDPVDVDVLVNVNPHGYVVAYRAVAATGLERTARRGRELIDDVRAI